MVSGIYALTNTVNGKRYIGSSRDVKGRMRRHIYDLRVGRHANPHLQAAFVLYGQPAFSRDILEMCPRDLLLEREQHWIDTVGPAYNIRAQASSNLGLAWSEGQRENLQRVVAAKWNDPAERARRVAKRRADWTPEARAAKATELSILATERWADPDKRTAHIASMKAVYASGKRKPVVWTEEMRAAQRDRMAAQRLAGAL